MEISIKQINNSDSLYQQVWQLRDDVLRKPLGMSLKNEDLSRDAKNAIFVALENESVIGCVLMQPIDNKEIQLRAMAVHFNHQGKGIGRMLVKHAEEYAKEKGLKKIILHARKVAIGFYTQLGYTLSDGKEFTEVNIPHYLMEKNL